MSFKTANPLPGDIGLVRITGAVGAGISLGQRLVGSGSYFTHAFVVVGDDLAVQAQPGGAVLTSLFGAVDGRRVAYSDFDLSDRQRALICAHAKLLVGTPYSFLDYAAIGAARFTGIKALEDYVSESGHVICSQLADLAYRRAGIDLFPNRIPGDVAPGDIARLIGA